MTKLTAKHTPGPWVQDNNPRHIISLSPQAQDPDICKVFGRFESDTPDANGQLIASAPDLAQALLAALPWLEQRGNDEVVAQAIAALTKAGYTKG